MSLSRQSTLDAHLSAVLFTLHLAIGRRKANKHYSVFVTDVARVVPDAQRNRNGIPHFHDEAIFTQRMFEPARQQMQNLIAVRMNMKRVSGTHFNRHAPERHRFGIFLCARNQPLDAAPIEIQHLTCVAFGYHVQSLLFGLPTTFYEIEGSSQRFRDASFTFLIGA